MLFFEELDIKQIEMLRIVFFEEICDKNEYKNVEDVPDAVLEEYFRHTVFEEKDFQAGIEKGELLEYAQFVGNYYGTPKFYVEKLLNEGKNVVLEIEVQGALQVMEKCPKALTIFLVPPSFEELERRIRGRRTETEDVVKQRLDKARKELATQDEYKYVVVNDNVIKAKEKIAKIIKENV